MYGEEVLHRGGPRVDAQPAAVRPAQGAELHRQQRLAAAIPQRAADQQLVVPGAVVVAGIEQRDAGVERGVDGGDALALVCGAVHPGHAHAAERQGKDRRTGRAELTRLMVCGWCHRSTLDRLASFGKKAPWRIFRIGADFSAPMVPRSVRKPRRCALNSPEASHEHAARSLPELWVFGFFFEARTRCLERT